jgi:NADPH-dependent 2,4-dienoyl-CoA reductase/sulfur reductase-like enzyme
LRQQGGVPGAFTLRTLEDARAIAAQLDRNPRVAVVGAGFIGLEVAASCKKRGLDVTVIEMQPAPLLELLGPQIARSVERMHVARGVQFRFGVSVVECQGAGRVERLLLSYGTALSADLVVIGIGVIPETRWLDGCGLALGDGVICDATLATNIDNIVAAGDVARWPNGRASGTERVEHWSNAVESGQAAAARLLDGPSTPPFVHVPYFWSDQYDVKLQFAGRVQPDDELTVVDGALDRPAYVALFGRAGRLTGVLASNRPAPFLRYRKLVAAGGDYAAACGRDHAS